MTNSLSDAFSKLISSPESNKNTIKDLVENVRSIKKTTLALRTKKIKSVTKVQETEEEYVYDIGMKNNKNPWFFANDILVHNSCYFSAYPFFKEEIERGEISWTKEDVINLYDTIAVQVSDTFPEFLKETFNVPEFRSKGIIKSSREIVSSHSLFIKKKRYAAMMIDKEGKRLDTNGKPGDIKVVGLDLRRSDTPKFMQEYLLKILTEVLIGKTEDQIINTIREFKEEFRNMKPWQKGSPMGVNNITSYMEKLDNYLSDKLAGKEVKTVAVPAQVTGSINWNKLRELNHDKHSMRITDGTKVVVCKLKESTENYMTTVCYPTDEVHLPDWFTSLPFDEEATEKAIFDKKMQNLLGVLNRDLSRADPQQAHIESLFEF